MRPFPRGWSGADIVFFDCDSTLSSIEGVDELARRRGADVADLTARAMAGEIAMEAVYAERLGRIAPTADDFDWLARRYEATAVEGAAIVVGALKTLGIETHVISGGLLPAVRPFAVSLGVTESHVHAVPFDAGNEAALDAAAQHPLARDGGKPATIARICEGRVPVGRRMLVGDGNSDLEAAPEVGLFLGFGGVVSRDAVRDRSAAFLQNAGLWATALLAAGPDRLAALDRVDGDLLSRARRDFDDPQRLVIQEP